MMQDSLALSSRYSRANVAAGVCFVFLLALAVRLTAVVRFQGLGAPPDYEAQPDQIDYEQFAFRLSEGHGYSLATGEPTARRPPGTSLALLPTYVLFGRSYAAGRVWFCTLSALTCAITVYVGRECYGDAVGLLAGLALAVYPGHFYYPMHFVSEVPFTFWLMLACGLTVTSLEATRRWRNLVQLCAGLSWGMAALTRPQILLVIPLGGLAVLLSAAFRKRFTVADLCIQLAAVALVVCPWVVRNALVLGKPTLSTVAGHTFWGANNPVAANDPRSRGLWIQISDVADETHPLFGNEVMREELAWRYGMEFVRRHPSKMPSLCLMKVYRLLTPFEATPNRVVFWSFGLAWLVVGPLSIYGIVAASREARDPTLVLLAPLLATVLTALIFYGMIRFRDLVAPLLLIFAALALVRLGSRCFTRGPSLLGHQLP